MSTIISSPSEIQLHLAGQGWGICVNVHLGVGMGKGRPFPRFVDTELLHPFFLTFNNDLP